MVHHKLKRKTSPYLLLLPLVLLLLTLIATLYALSHRIEERSLATAATTLSFTPISSPVSPLKQELNKTASYDILLRPGSNIVSFVQLEIDYDTAKFSPPDGLPIFQANAAFIPTVVEGPVYSDGKVLVSLSVGPNREGVISSPSRIGTISLKAKELTSSPTLLSFGPQTKVLSIGKGDESGENVLSTTAPSSISIISSDSTGVSATPNVDPRMGGLQLTVSLHGIGTSGDSINPASLTSNKNPQHPTRDISILVTDKAHTIEQNILGTLNYDPTTGKFSGVIPLSSLSDGIYSLRVKTDQYLRKSIPGFLEAHRGKVTPVPPVSLIGGDINGDNKINILDYGILIGCYSDIRPALSCTASQKDAADLNDDGRVDQADYNFFLRESSVQVGD